MIDKIYKILLFIYPPIILWVPEAFFIVNRVLGVSLLALFIIRFMLTTKSVGNVYYRYGLVFGFFIIISLFVNQSFNLVNVNIAVKYITPLIVGAYAYQFLDYRFFIKLFKFYFWFFLIVWFLRFAQFGFPLSSMMSMRDEVWWEKAVVFGFFYAAFYFGYALTNPSFLARKKVYKYIFIMPLFLIGSRSLIIGGAICVLIFVFNDLQINQKRIKQFFFAGIVGSLVFSLFIFDYIKNNEFLKFVLGSERSLKRENEELTLDSFSSGRTDVWNVYSDNISFEQILFGFGGVYEKAGVSLHNDFMEMFFYYGILMFIVYVAFFYKIYVIKAFKSVNYMFFAFYAFIQIQVLFNPFTSTMSSLYFLLLVVWMDKFYEKN